MPEDEFLVAIPGSSVPADSQACLVPEPCRAIRYAHDCEEREHKVSMANVVMLVVLRMIFARANELEQNVATLRAEISSQQVRLDTATRRGWYLERSLREVTTETERLISRERLALEGQ